MHSFKEEKRKTQLMEHLRSGLDFVERMLTSIKGVASTRSNSPWFFKLLFCHYCQLFENANHLYRLSLSSVRLKVPYNLRMSATYERWSIIISEQNFLSKLKSPLVLVWWDHGECCNQPAPFGPWICFAKSKEKENKSSTATSFTPRHRN